jgi:energy-coupling factor transporter ATP-binding protein EcfA2
MNHETDEIVKKYIAGDIEANQEKYKLLELDKEIITICEGRTLLALGEMTLVVGGKNSGKSKFVNHLIKQIIGEKCDAGYILTQKQDYRVVSFDSEMGIDRLVQWSIISPYEEEYGPSYIKENLVDKLYLYSLKKVTPELRIGYITDIVERLKKDNPNAHFIVCIDVGTCLTTDTNSSQNGGLIDTLVNKLSGNTLIVTIHHSLKDESKSGIGMGSIGTALEKLCAIKILVNPTDSEKRHKVEFLLSKYEDVNKDKDYFYLHTEKDDDGKIHLNGLSDSLGVVIRKKGNSKVADNEFSEFLIDLIENSNSDEERLRKNVKEVLMNKFNIGKSSVYRKIDKLIDDKIIKEEDDQLLVI